MAILSSSLVPTPSGWLVANEIQKGDLVFDHLGQPTMVNKVQEYTPTECYEVTLEDGLTIQGDKHLTLKVQDRVWRNCLSRYKNYKTNKKRRKFSRPLVELKVSDDIELRNGARLNYSVPNCLPVEYPSRDLPVPPYVFGIWFGTLTSTGRHWVRDQPMNKIQKVFRSYGHFIKTRKHKNGLMLFDIRPSVRDSFLFAGRDIPTSIPLYYLHSSAAQRMELIEGLIDSGFIKNHKNTNIYVAHNANYKLMRKIQGLVESIGLKTVLHTPYDSASYKLKFRMNADFSVLYGTNRRFIHKIEKIAPKSCTLIETDTQILVGEGYIPIC